MRCHNTTTNTTNNNTNDDDDDDDDDNKDDNDNNDDHNDDGDTIAYIIAIPRGTHSPRILVHFIQPWLALEQRYMHQRQILVNMLTLQHRGHSRQVAL
jgi:hypothetical protein